MLEKCVKMLPKMLEKCVKSDQKSLEKCEQVLIVNSLYQYGKRRPAGPPFLVNKNRLLLLFYFRLSR